jgi:hypothetical protein
MEQNNMESIQFGQKRRKFEVVDKKGVVVKEISAIKKKQNTLY